MPRDRPIRLDAIVVALCLLFPWVALADPSPIVQTDAGAVIGAVAPDGVASFKGIPFAKPPLGPLRWRPPQRAEPWSGVRPANAYGAICMQQIIKDNGVGPGPDSEDCLTLNVFAKSADVSDRAGSPVMVWIHGGGFVNGSGSAALYDGSKLAEQGVVVVTLNYRLGRFGFFAHPALTAERPAVPLANYGLMDQIAALRWVQRNIRAFGGDPSTVTVFGESAGGMSVNRLMTIPAAERLFKRAIVESGVGRDAGRTLAEAEARGRAFAAKMKVVDQTAAALRAIPADAIVADGEPPTGESPIVDGQLVKSDPFAAFQAGQETKVDYLVGSNSSEFPPSIVPPGLWPLPFSQAQQEVVRAAYDSKAAYDEHIISDVLFTEPARALAREHLKSGRAVYLYRFSVLSAGAPKTLKGAVHASDRQYVFQTLSASPWPTDTRDAALAETISAYWVAFAKTGDPNGAERPHWPRYDQSDELLDFTNDGPVVKKTPDAARLDAIASTYGPAATSP